MRRSLPFIAVALGLAGCDQVSKAQAVSLLTEFAATAANGEGGHDPGGLAWRFVSERHPRAAGEIAVVDGFWRLRYVENPGGFWSLLHDLSPAWRRGLLLAFSLVGMAFMLVWLGRVGDDRVTALALALTLGGALGNFIDRARLGYVVDFIQWHWRDELYWPVFNMADVAISVGVTLLLLLQLLSRRQGRRSTPA